MTSRVSEWRLEDRIVFVKKIAKSFGGSIPESDLEFILESFGKNHMIGAGTADSIFGISISLQRGDHEKNKTRGNRDFE